MKLGSLAAAIEAKVLTQGAPAEAEIDSVYAGDKVSDLLNAASDRTLLVTNLSNNQLVKMAELMDVPGICLVSRNELDAATLEAARKRGTVVLTSPFDMFETCGRLYRCLRGQDL